MTYKERREQRRKQAQAFHQPNADEQLISANAFRLLAHSETIIANSKMALCPLEVRCCLAISGSIKDITLGGLVYWWRNDKHGHVKLENGDTALLYRLCGSGYGNGNASFAADAQGGIHELAIPYFMATLHSFIDAKSRFKLTVNDEKPYSLQEVIDKLAESEIIEN